MKDSGLNQKSLTILWLNLANAYGTLPYKLIQYAFERNGIPSQCLDLILAYYDGNRGKYDQIGLDMRKTYQVMKGGWIAIQLN